ncbi:MAG TPA: glycoside hydrolase family 6 protein [Solirubrobacteraceae bacterium]|nr:glycoside hydrolase family 6 protein [Solirubrobacteraceae bacterium]
MNFLRRLTILSISLLGALVAPVAAHADPAQDPTGFHLDSSSLYVHENAGQAVITISRSNTSVDAQIRYITLGSGVQCGSSPCTAIDPYDFSSVKGMLDFPVGVASETFTMPVVDHGVSSVPKTIEVSLFGPSPIGVASPSKAVLTILNDDPVSPRDPVNPLALPVAPANGNPLSGASFFVDPQSEPAHAAKADPTLNVIAREPGTARFGRFSFGKNGVPDIQTAVSRYLARASVQSPGTVPLLATYRILNGLCSGHRASDSPAEAASYHNFIEGFAQGIGSYRAVLFLEMDSIITMPCLSGHGKAVREHELHDAINILSADCPHLVIYLDAGAGDALHARDAAHYLRASGVSSIEGFFLNSTHFDWTSHEIRYGRQISRMLGGKHFVVNTGENGIGPQRPRDIVHQGMEVLCNPRAGLGPLPTANTGYRNVDMFAWTSNPGESGGKCVAGAPPTGQYWPAYAKTLVHNADFKVR